MFVGTIFVRLENGVHVAPHVALRNAGRVRQAVEDAQTQYLKESSRLQTMVLSNKFRGTFFKLKHFKNMDQRFFWDLPNYLFRNFFKKFP